MHKNLDFVKLTKIEGKYLRGCSENYQKSFAFFIIMRYNIIIEL